MENWGKKNIGFFPQKTIFLESWHPHKSNAPKQLENPFIIDEDMGIFDQSQILEILDFFL